MPSDYTFDRQIYIYMEAVRACPPSHGVPLISNLNTPYSTVPSTISRGLYSLSFNRFPSANDNSAIASRTFANDINNKIYKSKETNSVKKFIYWKESRMKDLLRGVNNIRGSCTYDAAQSRRCENESLILRKWGSRRSTKLNQFVVLSRDVCGGEGGRETGFHL